MKITSIAITAKEWFDKVNGNSYFSASIQVNGEHVHTLPFQYGYGSQYEWEANRWLAENGYINNPRNDNGIEENLSIYCRDHDIALYSTKIPNCRKRDLDK